ncbi:hypothetical protein [Nannocystis sp. SCPEA4]|uniref:hypothetical protein n=1 Tax=Nannocystis sp. SCPEA4 TaxID=2996787 RepID=UPI002271EF1E|nr:hypothetical protein [Nannocystis sp. SCPEA4]MCY1059549.1 hypothetical protein [Nannocystis sp. SCPEA4]
MTTYLRQARTSAAQQVAPFTGEGAYHGSTRPRVEPLREAPAPPLVDELRPRTLEQYAAEDRREIAEFEAVFPNHHAVVETLPIPTQEAIQSDGVSFCWCPIDDAVREAGPLTRSVLEAMRAHVGSGKRHVYIDSKIQYFAPGDVPVDSQHWHVDGSIVARDERARRLGHALLHDMKARLQAPALGPRYLAYQSSGHCATLFATAPVTLTLPELIPNFDELDRRVRALAPPAVAQPPGSIVRFDGLSLHRAVAATDAGWRLWVRCVETDRVVTPDASIIACYGKVYRTPT